MIYGDNLYKLFADAIVLVHFLFIAFVAGGGLLILRWPRLAWVHLPAVVWGTTVEFSGFVCPLTPLENHFRRLGGNSSYNGDFVAQYVLRLIYPENMTVGTQHNLGGLVIAVNLFFYSIVIRNNYLRSKTQG
jgi:hypothetical protein